MQEVLSLESLAQTLLVLHVVILVINLYCLLLCMVDVVVPAYMYVHNVFHSQSIFKLETHGLLTKTSHKCYKISNCRSFSEMKQRLSPVA